MACWLNREQEQLQSVVLDQPLYSLNAAALPVADFFSSFLPRNPATSDATWSCNFAKNLADLNADEPVESAPAATVFVTFLARPSSFIMSCLAYLLPRPGLMRSTRRRVASFWRWRFDLAALRAC